MPRRNNAAGRRVRRGSNHKADASTARPSTHKHNQYEAIASRLVLAGICGPHILDNPARYAGPPRSRDAQPRQEDGS